MAHRRFVRLTKIVKTLDGSVEAIGCWQDQRLTFVHFVWVRVDAESAYSTLSGYGGSHLVSSCSFGLVWLINRTFSANKQYFSLTSNQPTVLSTMVYQPNKPKRTGRVALQPSKK